MGKSHSPNRSLEALTRHRGAEAGRTEITSSSNVYGNQSESGPASQSASATRAVAQERHYRIYIYVLENTKYFVMKPLTSQNPWYSQQSASPRTSAIHLMKCKTTSCTLLRRPQERVKRQGYIFSLRYATNQK